MDKSAHFTKNVTCRTGFAPLASEIIPPVCQVHSQTPAWKPSIHTNVFANLLSLLTLSKQESVFHPFMRVRRCVRRRVGKNLLTRSRQLSQTTLKQIPPVCHRDSRPERSFSKIIRGFAAMCTSFPYDKKVFPCKIKIKPRELIYLLYGQKHTRRGKWITICKRNRKEQKKIRILVPRKGTKKEALLTRCLFLHEKKSFMNASLFVPSSTCPSSPSFQEQEQKLSFLHSICSIQR